MTPLASCPFCKIVEDNQDHRIIHSNYLAFAILDAYPVSTGHALIIPKRHCQSFFDISFDERNALLNLLDVTKNTIDQLHQPSSYNIGINDGPAAGQTVPHLHIHLIPRYEKAGSDPRGGIRWVIPEKADYWSRS